MSALLELISNFLEITGNTVVDNIIIASIGVISFCIAFGIVGMIFDALGKYDSDIMSDCHWIIRFLVFIVLSVICICFAKLIAWLCSFQWWVYMIAGLVIVGLIVMIYVIKYKLAKKKVSIEKETLKAEKTVEYQGIDEKNFCPRCGGLLVKRHGPSGSFYGCENYSKNNCKYTRKFI